MTQINADPPASSAPVAQRGEDQPVLIDATRSGVVTLTLNRPRKKNAFGPDLILALSDAFETLHGADHIKAVFLRGEGGTFSAGADLGWMAESADWLEDDNRQDAMRLAVMLKKLNDLPQLTVALVEGAAFGGGAGLIAACDLAIAAENSTFAFSEVKLGLIPATISPYVIRAIGPRNAKMLFASARAFGAEEAVKWGLVHEVVKDSSDFPARVESLCAAMAACAPEAVAQSKRLVEDVVGRRIDHGLLEFTAHAIAHRRASVEAKEGVAAFLGKRPPNWTQ